MFPLGNVVAFAIAIVLQTDGVHEICVLQFRVDCFDFFIQIHVMRSLPLMLENRNQLRCLQNKEKSL